MPAHLQQQPGAGALGRSCPDLQPSFSEQQLPRCVAAVRCPAPAAGRGLRGLLRPAGSQGDAQGGEGISTENGEEGGGCQPRSQLYPEPAELWLSQL